MIFRNYLSFCIVCICACCLFFGSTVAREAIVNGFQVDQIVKMPYVVSVQKPRDIHVCGGGLIHHQFVLTAAQCFVERNGIFISGHPYVLVGSTSLKPISSKATSVEVQRVYVPREYSPNSYVGDIALLELKHAIWENSTQAIGLIEESPQNLIRKLVLTAGYGWNIMRLKHDSGPSGQSNGQLHYGRGFVPLNAKCEQAYPGGIYHSAIHLCAQMFFGAPCKGDIGGLLVRTYDIGGRNKSAVGVLIKTTPHCEARGHAALFTSISHYRKFIEDVVAGRKSRKIRVHTVDN